MSGKTLIVGVGSPHGDDQIGWQIVERLRADRRAGWSVRTVRNPSELLACLGDNVERLVICDACYGSDATGKLQVWRWPTSELQFARASGSHDFDLTSVLDLAGELGLLPPSVTICGIQAKQHLPAASLSDELVAALQQVVSRIRAICEAAEGAGLSTCQRQVAR
jgi:hydrogenase maturation protease